MNPAPWDQIYHSPENIAEMNGDTCQRLLSRIAPFLIHISPGDRSTDKEMRRRLQRPLKELKIDGPLAMVRKEPLDKPHPQCVNCPAL